ncbi:MAG: alpha/beta fold hydrolase [Turicibacter sp.]
MTDKRLENTPIHYYMTGNKSGECMIFVHAAFANHTSFNSQLEFFSKRYQIITLDLIGHGQSIHSKKGDGIDKTAEYIHQIMKVENLNKIHLIGVSIGAVLIQDFANEYPESVASLCCIGGYDINNFDASIQKENSKAQIKMMLKAIISIKWFSAENKKISAFTEEAQEAFYQMNIQFKRSSFRYLTTLSKLVNQQETKKRLYPLLIVCGEKDNKMAIKAANLWHKSEPDSQLKIFEGAGHLVNMDIPNEFNDFLYNQLKLIPTQ